MPRLDHLARHFERLCALGEAEQQTEIEKLDLGESDRAMLASLLAADRRDGDPIQAAISCGAANIHKPDTLLFGPWRLLRELGAGGMGTVFLAERSDGHFAQHVAIKVLRGFPTSASMRRLRQERQILAGLDHPNIARLLDGGETAEGQPWLAMEYVDGLPLLEFASAHAPSLNDRLGLFQAMLDAIEHAHQHLIVHRDLKPANVLVTTHGTVKLLDFGIARLIEAGEETLNSTSTQIYSRGYASPEQREGRSITTASDIYSLGVMLRELLTGKRDDVPQHPPVLAALALDADLAGILAKACAVNPRNRYPSVGELRDDLIRFREGRPVRASAMTRTYRLRKFAGRHRVGVATAMLAVLFGAAFVWRLDRERERAVKAESAARHALQASVRDAAAARSSLQFLTDALSAAAPDIALKKQIGVRELLDAARAKLDARGGTNRALSQAMQRLLAKLYSELGETRIARDLMRDGLSGIEPADGAEALRMADDYAEFSKLLGALEDSAAAMAAAQTATAWREKYAADDVRLRVQSLQMLAMLHHRAGNDGEAIELLRKSIDLGVAKTADDLDTRIESLQLVASLLATRGECDQALRMADEGLMLAKSLAAESPVRLPLMRARASALNACGRAAEAELILRDAIALQDRVVANGGTRMMSLTNDLALTLNDLGRYQEAAVMLQRSDDLVHLGGMGNVEQATTWVNRAGILENAGDYPASLAASARAVALLDEAQVDADRQERRRIERTRARTLGLAGESAKGWSMLEDLRKRALRIEGAESGEYAMITWQQAILAERMGNQAAGLALVDEAARLWHALVPGTHPLFAHVLRLRGKWAIRQHDLERAEEHLRQAIKVLDSDSASVVDLAIARSELAGVLHQRRQDGQAAQLLEQAMPVLRRTLLPSEINRAIAETLVAKLAGAN